MRVVPEYLYVREGKVSLTKHGWAFLLMRPGPERSRLAEESFQLKDAG